MITCKNSNHKGPAIMGPGCQGAAAVKLLVIHYNRFENEKLELCQACLGAISQDANCRYGLTITKLKGVKK